MWETLRPHSHYPRLICRIFLVFAILPASRVDAQVRAPRDTPGIVHGRMEPSSSVDLSQYRATQTPLSDFALKQTLPIPLGVDPGYRPLWIPGTYVWNGSGWVWAPGHWVWEPRPSF